MKDSKTVKILFKTDVLNDFDNADSTEHRFSLVFYGWMNNVGPAYP